MIIKESRNVELFSWDELTPKQQDYIIDNWQDIRKIANTVYEWFNDDLMLFYEENRDELADKYEKEYGLKINTEQLYWNESSQGPYPNWQLNRVFSDISGTDTDVDYEILFADWKGFDVVNCVCVDIYIDDTDNSERIYDNQYTLEELEASDTVSTETFDKINRIVQGAQKFIDEFWSYVNDICTSYPDDNWVRDMLDSNPYVFDFYIDDNADINVW